MWVVERIASVVVMSGGGVVGIRVDKSCGGFAEILGAVGVEELAILVSILGGIISGEHDRRWVSPFIFQHCLQEL